MHSLKSQSHIQNLPKETVETSSKVVKTANKLKTISSNWQHTTNIINRTRHFSVSNIFSHPNNKQVIHKENFLQTKNKM